MALVNNLKRVGKFFDENGVKYWIDSGVTVGAVKLRSVLPWDSGDIDVNVDHNLRDLVNLLRTKFVKLHPEYKIYADHIMTSVQLRHGFEGPTTIWPQPKHRVPQIIIRMDCNGFMMPVSKDIFKHLRGAYHDYLVHHKHRSKSSIFCSERSNACLPDFRKILDGRGGHYAEFYYED